MALLSLVQENAFDCVSPAFLFTLLEQMGFVAMVQLVYAGVVSHVFVNRHCSRLIEQ